MINNTVIKIDDFYLSLHKDRTGRAITTIYYLTDEAAEYICKYIDLEQAKKIKGIDEWKISFVLHK